MPRSTASRAPPRARRVPTALRDRRARASDGHRARLIVLAARSAGASCSRRGELSALPPTSPRDLLAPLAPPQPTRPGCPSAGPCSCPSTRPVQTLSTPALRASPCANSSAAGRWHRVVRRAVGRQRGRHAGRHPDPPRCTGETTPSSPRELLVRAVHPCCLHAHPVLLPLLSAHEHPRARHHTWQGALRLAWERRAVRSAKYSRVGFCRSLADALTLPCMCARCGCGGGEIGGSERKIR